MINFCALPDDTAARRKIWEKRAEPSSERPAMDPQLETELAETEEKTAQCYIDAEEMTYRLERAAERINGWVPRYGLIQE